MLAENTRFDPPRRKGITFHSVGLLIFGILALGLFLQLTRTDLGETFLFYLLGAVFTAAPLPFLGYRLYALNRSFYSIGREGIRLQWGFRQEDIPMSEVNWVRLAEDLTHPLQLPWPAWPGGVVGSRRHPDAGLVEFLASDSMQLVIIGTGQRVYAISPEDPQRFISVFHEQVELGSISPIPAYSAFPSFLLSEAWRSPTGRVFMSVSILLSLVLFIWVGLAVPQRDLISLGFTTRGVPLPPVQAIQLFLLPVVNVFLTLAGIIMASYFHRKQQNHPLAFVIWTSTNLMGILFLGAVLIILINS